MNLRKSFLYHRIINPQLRILTNLSFKNIIIFSLAVFFLYTYLFYYFIAYYQLATVKKDFQNEKEDSLNLRRNIVVLAFKKTEITHVVNHEIILKNQRYDIVKKEIKDDSVFYDCILDIEENELFEEIEIHCNIFLNHFRSAKKSKLVINFLLKDFLCLKIFKNDFSKGRSLIRHSTVYKFTSVSYFLSRVNPPPQNTDFYVTDFIWI